MTRDERRDMFAAAALTGLITYEGCSEQRDLRNDDIRRVYAYADEMLRRNKADNEAERWKEVAAVLAGHIGHLEKYHRDAIDSMDDEDASAYRQARAGQLDAERDRELFGSVGDDAEQAAPGRPVVDWEAAKRLEDERDALMQNCDALRAKLDEIADEAVRWTMTGASPAAVLGTIRRHLGDHYDAAVKRRGAK